MKITVVIGKRVDEDASDLKVKRKVASKKRADAIPAKVLRGKGTKSTATKAAKKAPAKAATANVYPRKPEEPQRKATAKAKEIPEKPKRRRGKFPGPRVD